MVQHKQVQNFLVTTFTTCIFCLHFSAISIAEELVADPQFVSQGASENWWSTPNSKIDYRDGKLCVTALQSTSEPWDAIIGLNDFKLEANIDYAFSYEVSGKQIHTIRGIVQEGQEPWTPLAEVIETIGSDKEQYGAQFSVVSKTDKAQIVFQFGGAKPGEVFCLSNVSLSDGAIVGGNTAVADIALHVNQVGYLPKGPKFASLVHPSEEALRWSLNSSSGKLLANGRTKPLGFDPSSGLDIHQINFTKYVSTGNGFYLDVDGEKSDPFVIGSEIYDPIRIDALSYFYLVRSGTELSSDIVGREFARPVGHTKDKSVKCLDKRMSREIYKTSWTCDYKLDVSGGWYDAGDFGKYVVNGGISVAQVMGSYERALLYAGSGSGLLGQKILRTANSQPRLPDVLAEAKWELDFLMRMQVPEGQKYAGLVHHKIHGIEWNGLPLWPHKDPVPRALHRPSTAATLNLAATTAQAARLFKPYDPAYAEKLLQVAKRSYAAARKTPDLYAPSSNGQYGGGDYPDNDVLDEFYWAESELFISTGEQVYLERLKASKYWASGVFRSSGMDWSFLAGLARLQLALVPNQLPEQDRLLVQKSVLSAADNFLAMQSAEAFDIMFKADEGFGWGSNHSVLQNMIVVASAYDLVKDKKYLDAVRKGMDYILGRNALGISYVTGHGTRSSQNQHARIFAKNHDSSFPPMPAGALAGGPNSWPADEFAIKVLKDCAPQTCYIDDHRSFSTNEIAINWNAALSWITAFLVDTAQD